MKICWDNLEGVHLAKSGTFRKNGISYVYKEPCAKCGEPYLTEKGRQSKFCGRSCINKGRKFSEEQKKKLSIAKGGKNNPFYGKTHTVEAKKKMSENKFGNKMGISNPNWKGGISIIGLARYGIYGNKLKFYEDVGKRKNTEILEIKCAYCGRWFSPTDCAVNNRLTAINNLNQGECRLYCSENCKQACPTYRRRKYPKGFKHTTSREVSPQLRQMVFERDNWTCQICGKTSKETTIHCHHMDPVAQNPMLQNDMDSCVTLCKGCHKMVHSRRGCRYVDLQCKNKNEFNTVDVMLKI